MNHTAKHLGTGVIAGSAITVIILKIITPESAPESKAETNTSHRHSPQTLHNPPDYQIEQRKPRNRQLEERDQYLLEIGEKRKLPLGEYRLLDHTGSVSELALEKAGIQKEEKGTIQKLIDDAENKAKELILSSSKVRIPESGELPQKKGSEARYFIKTAAQTSGGNEILKGLKSSLQEKYGAKSTEIMLEGLDDQRPMGAFGSQNQSITIIYNKSIDKWSVNWSYINPKTGEPTRRGETEWRTFLEKNGDWIIDAIGTDPTSEQAK